MKLTTEERLGVASKVIKKIGIKDEDLKQEMYVKALEFSDEGCDECDTVTFCNCLEKSILMIAFDYLSQTIETQDKEECSGIGLDHFDDLIIHFLMSALNKRK